MVNRFSKLVAFTLLSFTVACAPVKPNDRVKGTKAAVPPTLDKDQGDPDTEDQNQYEIYLYGEDLTQPGAKDCPLKAASFIAITSDKSKGDCHQQNYVAEAVMPANWSTRFKNEKPTLSASIGCSLSQTQDVATHLGVKGEVPLRPDEFLKTKGQYFDTLVICHKINFPEGESAIIANHLILMQATLDAQGPLTINIKDLFLDNRNEIYASHIFLGVHNNVGWSGSGKLVLNKTKKQQSGFSAKLPTNE